MLSPSRPCNLDARFQGYKKNVKNGFYYRIEDKKRKAMQDYIEQSIGRVKRAWEEIIENKQKKRVAEGEKNDEDRKETWQEMWKRLEGSGEDWEAAWQKRWKRLEEEYLTHEPMPVWYQPNTQWDNDEDYAKAYWERRHAAHDRMRMETWEERIHVERRKRQEQAHLDRSITTTDQTYSPPFLIKDEIYQGLRGVEVGGGDRVEFDYYTDIDINKAGIGQLCCVVTYTRSDLGYFVRSENAKPGLDGSWGEKSLSILSPVNSLQEADRFVITESPIDALSHRQLEQTGLEGWRLVVEDKQVSVPHDQQTTVYINVGSYITKEERKYLEAVCQLAREKDKTMVLAVNKDSTGSTMAENLIPILKEAGTNYHIEKPTLELSWNNTIRLFPSRSQMVEEIAMRELEGEIYQASVLPQLGIEQETLRGFKDQLKVTGYSVEMPLLKTVEGTWSLSIGQQGSIKLPVSEGLPPLATLKGDPLQAEQVVLVRSPLDALLHYQAKHQIYRDRATLDCRKLELASLASTCYMYVGKKDCASVHPFESVTQMLKDKNLSLAIRGDQDIRFDSLEENLRQQGVGYKKELIDTNAQVYKKLNLLTEMLKGVTDVRGVGEKGGGEDEGEQQRRNINKKQGYRPSL
jgi:hypothetical protein